MIDQSKIKFIYFDGMGVLLEVNKPLSHYFSQALGFAQEKFHEYETETIRHLSPEMSKRFWNLSTLGDEIKYCRAFNQLFLKIADIDGDDKLIEQLTQYRVKPDVGLGGGVADGLKKLTQTYRMGVLTNAMPSRKSYELTIDGIDQYLDPIIISREFGCHKPEPRLYEEAIKRSNTDSSEILFIDDKEEYLQAALSVGIGQVILFGSDCSPDQFTQVNDFTELVDLLL